MKIAGKAFIGGIFGTIGVGTAIFGITGIVVLVGQRKIKRIVADLEKTLKDATEKLLDGETE